jgi:hypothetical protein
MFVASGSTKDCTWEEKHGKNKKTVVILSQCPWVWVKPWKDLDHKQREKDASYMVIDANLPSQSVVLSPVS